MKYLFNKRAAILFLFLSIFGTTQTFSQVGIGTTTPNASAALDIVSTDGGLLIPRMTLAQISALTVDASTAGLLVYRTDTTPGFYYYNGTAWGTFTGAGSDSDWTIVGNDMYNANSGNVGIGTSTPAAKLHIEDVSTAPDILDDGFEDNSIAPFTTNNWSVSTSTVNTGTYSANSGTTADNTTSYLDYAVTVPASGATVTFAYSVSSEATYDFLRFYIDGALQNQWSGSVSYTTASYTLSAGSYTLRWAYVKDINTAGGSDRAFIDDVNIVPTQTGSAIRIVDGLQSSGKVLTSDANGNASWQNPASSNDNDWTVSGSNMYNANSGNVGVGTTTSANKLHVQHNQDGAGVMRVQNNSDGGFAGIYFNQNDSYRGHIGYVNTGGTSTFGGKGAFQVSAGNRPFVITNGTTELYTESLRITQDKKLRIFRDGSGGANYWDTYVNNGNGQDPNDYVFAYNGTVHAYIRDGSGAFQVTSDRRLKDNISPLGDYTLEKVLALNPVSYHYKRDENKISQNGFIAQEVQPLFPEIVDEIDGYLSVNYDAFGVLAIKAIQEQQKTITQQEERITHLENEISEIKQMLLDKK
ncbi:tail fiber domain-containing protein [Lacinutrix sp. Hel_I_90]|uniref:tail fiber domain-containing protein n=1 Tax=Lacinutrix sp. Hel_I_90 TaxID=1249999 RepID=UPI0005CAD9DF|nr:tail fiber domain-containing protein [Lacinutrix sp. Hel_I_90]